MFDLEKLKKYEYISFDIFDTLLKRNINEPSDIFKVVEKKYNDKNNKKIYNFKTIRINSEKKCRNGSSEEIKLNSIYNEICKEYDVNIAEELKKLEIETELEFIQKNKFEDINEIYRWAYNNKKVILISDMYLSQEIIEKMLKKCGIKYYKLYVSSEIGKRKSTSELFTYVMNDLNIKSQNIFHIGDNLHSDKKMAKKCGIESFLIPTKIKRASYLNKSNYSVMKENLDYNIVETFINNNIATNDSFEKFGYECFGILLYYFCKWLINELQRENIQKVYFLARDGKVIKEMFDIINKENTITSNYLMASRRSLIVPSFWKCNNIDEVLNSFNIPKKITLDDLFKRLGLDDIDIDSIVQKYNLKRNFKYEFNKLKVDNNELFNELFPIIIDNSKTEYVALIKYLEKMKFDGKVAIVDIGWYGNMQEALYKISNADIYGYYFGLRNGKKETVKSKGYLFDKGFNEEYDLKELCFNSIFEFIFSATHGSVKRFIDNEQNVELYENENGDNFIEESLKKLQSGSKKFVIEYSDSNLEKYAYLDAKTSVINIFEFLNNPIYKDSVDFGNIKFKDGETNYIAHSLGLKKYLCNPKKFINDFNASSWKIGFLKRTLKINLPYEKIYNLLKSLKNKNDL